MRQISRHTWCVDDIVESKLVDKRASLEQQRKRLTDTARGSCNDCCNMLVELKAGSRVIAAHSPTFILNDVLLCAE